MAEKKTRWTVVQHSGFAFNNDVTFKNGLESKQLDDIGDQKTVKKSGGILFDSHDDAVKYEEKEIGEDMIPNVPGTFAKQTIDGQRIYIPKVMTKKIEVRFLATFKTTLEVPINATRQEIGEELSNVCIPETDEVEYICDTFDPCTDEDGHPTVYKDSSKDE